MTAIALSCFAAIVYAGYVRLLVPFEINYSEGLLLSAAVRVLDGETPYPEPASFPYPFNLFGPTGYLLIAAAIKVLGLSLFGPRPVVQNGNRGRRIETTVTFWWIASAWPMAAPAGDREGEVTW